MVSNQLLDYLRAHGIIVLSKPNALYAVSIRNGTFRTTVPEQHLLRTLKTVAKDAGITWPAWDTDGEKERM